MAGRKAPTVISAGPNQIGALSWEEDPICQARATIVARQHARHHTVSKAMLAAVNDDLMSAGLPTIEIATLKSDVHRLAERFGRENRNAVWEAVNEHDEFIEDTRNDIQNTTHDQARAQMRSVVQRAISEKAKITGASIIRTETKVEHTEVKVLNILFARILPKYLTPEQMMQLLEEEEVKRLPEAFIDAEFRELLPANT